MNVIDYFDRVRIINISSRKDRRLETVEEFARNGFHIDDEKIGFFEAVTPSEGNGFPSVGVRGCFLSHLGVLEEAMRLNLKNILILEDDIQFSRHISQYGREAIESLEGMEWDIVYFGHPFEENSNLPAWKAVDRPIHLAHFYAVNGKCFGKLRDFYSRFWSGHRDILTEVRCIMTLLSIRLFIRIKKSWLTISPGIVAIKGPRGRTCMSFPSLTGCLSCGR